MLKYNNNSKKKRRGEKEKERNKEVPKTTSRNGPLPDCEIIHFMLQVCGTVFPFKINVYYGKGV